MCCCLNVFLECLHLDANRSAIPEPEETINNTLTTYTLRNDTTSDASATMIFTDPATEYWQYVTLCDRFIIVSGPYRLSC